MLTRIHKHQGELMAFALLVLLFTFREEAERRALAQFNQDGNGMAFEVVGSYLI